MNDNEYALVWIIGIFCLAYFLNNIVHSWRRVQLAKHNFAEDDERSYRETQARDKDNRN